MQTPKPPSAESTLAGPGRPGASAPSPSQRRGATIGRYVLLDVLGKGGMGIVYSAFDPKLDRKIAVKVLRPRGSDESSEAQDRLLREAQAMARLSHPNVVAVHDVGAFEGGVFLAMELVEGTTLDGWLAAGDKTRSWRARLDAMKAAGRGLSAAHAARIVHRDFKPDNVLVGRDGRVCVTDFGIARSALGGLQREPAAPPGSSPPQPPALETTLTVTGSVLGTIGFMAPEQAFGEEADARSDQFGFCATLYFALYGERPFPSGDLETYTEALRGPVRSAPAGSAVPAWLRRVVLRGLAISPDARYPSMDALLDALDRDPAVVRRRWIGAGVVLGGLALAGLGIRGWSQRKASACLREVPGLSGAWDDQIRREARAAFVASGAPNATDAFDRTANVLDAYASTWSAMYRGACEDTRVRGDQPEEVYRLRADCLDRQKGELRALTSLFRRADAPLVETSTRAAYGLPALSYCGDVRALRANVGLPDDPEKRARVEEALTALAEADALELGDRSREALAVAERALSLARAAGHEGTEAEALYVVGHAQTRLTDEAGAQRSLANAAWAGLASGQLAVVVRASAIEAYITGVDFQLAGESRAWLARAKGALERMGGNDELEAFVASREAAVLLSLDHRPELALPLAELAVATDRRLFGAHPNTEHELQNLGDTYEGLGNDDAALAAYRESLAMAERLYGPESLRTGVALAHVGDALLKLGDVDEATHVFERALGIFERYGNAFWIVATLQDLTQAANRRNDPTRALALGERGLALLETPDASPVLLPASCVTTADALLALNRPGEALALCERALAAQEVARVIDPDKVYEWDALRCRGEALLSLHRASEAVSPLERSVGLPRREWPGDLARARSVLARALAEAHGP